jgi:hypothetical protein
MPDPSQFNTELQSSNDIFFSTLARPGAQARRAKVAIGRRVDACLSYVA